MKPLSYLKKAWRDVSPSDMYTVKGNFRTSPGKLDKDIFPYDKGGFTSNGALALVDYNYNGKFTDTPNPIERLKANKGELTCRFAITRQHFERMVNCANSIRANMLTLNINGRIEVSAKSDIGNTYGALSNGEIWRITKTKKSPGLYRKLGNDTIFYINPKYLLDALSGFQDVIIVSIYGNLMILQDDNREAWIMAMNPGGIR